MECGVEAVCEAKRQSVETQVSGASEPKGEHWSQQWVAETKWGASKPKVGVQNLVDGVSKRPQKLEEECRDTGGVQRPEGISLPEVGGRRLLDALRRHFTTCIDLIFALANCAVHGKHPLGLGCSWRDPYGMSTVVLVALALSSIPSLVYTPYYIVSTTRYILCIINKIMCYPGPEGLQTEFFSGQLASS